MPKAASGKLFLCGGKSRKGGTTVKVKRERFLGGGAEGTVFESELAVSKTGKEGSTRERQIRLARKEFGRHGLIDWGGNFRKPKKQFELVKELMDLNKKKKLGLRLPKTLRLIEEGKTSLAITFYPKYKKTGLRPRLGFWQWKEKKQFSEDKHRQIEILEREGITALYKWGDVFAPLIQPNGECIALLGDFGNLIKTEEKESGQIWK